MVLMRMQSAVRSSDGQSGECSGKCISLLNCLVLCTLALLVLGLGNVEDR